MAYETLKYDVAEGICTITLNRPDKLNAFDDTMKAEMLAALKEAEKDLAVRCVVVTGEGRAFCSGQDLAARQGAGFAEYPIGDMLRKLYHPFIVKIRTMQKPVIAAVNGAAAGMGMSLALACDYRIMAEGAYMMQAFIKIGLIPDCGSTFFLPRYLGMGRAFELMATGDKVDAKKCLDWGLANEVVPAEKLAEAVKTTAGAFATGPTAAYGLIKRALNNSIGLHFEDQLDFESYAQQVAARSADFAEGVKAFAERRSPAFSGR